MTRGLWNGCDQEPASLTTGRSLFTFFVAEIRLELKRIYQ